MRNLIRILLLLVSINCSAAEPIFLRCHVKVNGNVITREVWKNGEGLTTKETNPKDEPYSYDDVSYFVITTDDEKYLKIQRSDDIIYSTVQSESKFLSWDKKDLTIKIINNSDFNRINLVARMNIRKKDLMMDVLERIKIDRISGNYERIYEVDSASGVLLSEMKSNHITYRTERYKDVGVCGNFTRKF